MRYGEALRRAVDGDRSGQTICREKLRSVSVRRGACVDWACQKLSRCLLLSAAAVRCCSRSAGRSLDAAVRCAAVEVRVKKKVLVKIARVYFYTVPFLLLFYFFFVCLHVCAYCVRFRCVATSEKHPNKPAGDATR